MLVGENTHDECKCTQVTHTYILQETTSNTRLSRTDTVILSVTVSVSGACETSLLFLSHVTLWYLSLQQINQIFLVDSRVCLTDHGFGKL